MMHALGLQPRDPVPQKQRLRSPDSRSTERTRTRSPPRNVTSMNLSDGDSEEEITESGFQVTKSSNVFSSLLNKGKQLPSLTSRRSVSAEESKKFNKLFSSNFHQEYFDDQSKYSFKELQAVKHSHATPAAIRNAQSYAPSPSTRAPQGPWIVPQQPQNILVSTSANRKVIEKRPISELIDRENLLTLMDSGASKDLLLHFGKRTKARYWDKSSGAKNRTHTHTEGVFIFESHCRLFAAHEGNLKVTGALTDIVQSLFEEELSEKLVNVRSRLKYLLEMLGRINGVTVCELQALRSKDLGEKCGKLWYQSLIDVRQTKLDTFPHIAPQNPRSDNWGFAPTSNKPTVVEAVKRDFHTLCTRLLTLQKTGHIPANEVITVGAKLLNTVGYTSMRKTNGIKRVASPSTTPRKRQVTESATYANSTTPKKPKKKKKKKKKATTPGKQGN